MLKYLVLGFLLRLCVSAWNAFWGPSIGAEFDAKGLHATAFNLSYSLEFDRFSVGTEVYTNFLGFMYWLFSNSVFFGGALSALAWVFSARLLDKSMEMLEVPVDFAHRAMLVYALLPSSLMFTSVTLREAYQLMFVNMAAYSFLRLYIDGKSSHWIWMLLACVIGGATHGGLLAFMMIFFVGAIVTLRLQKSDKTLSVGAALGFAVVVGAAVAMLGSVVGNIGYNLGGDGLSAAAAAYQEGVINADGRTNYKHRVDFDGGPGMVLFLVQSMLQYLFEPMPWRISAMSDIPVFAENVLRAYLIFLAIRAYRVGSDFHRRLVVQLFGGYLVAEAIWSLGTVNWGTAVRHHLPTMGLLLLSASLSLAREPEWVEYSEEEDEELEADAADEPRRVT